MIRGQRSNQEDEERISVKRKAPPATQSSNQQELAISGSNLKDDSPNTRRKVIPANSQSNSRAAELQKMEEALSNEVLPSVVCSKSCLQLRAVSMKNVKGQVVGIQWRVVVEHISDPDHCLDADIGMVLPNCQGCCWESRGPQVKLYDLSIAASPLILRQDYFTTRRGGVDYFPRTICVSDRTYSLHRCQCETAYCFAVPYTDGDQDFTFAPKVGSDARYLIKIAKEVPFYGYRYDRAFEADAHLLTGEQIVPTRYGEVYRAILRTRQHTTSKFSANTYDNFSCSEVAAKIVRHLNDHCGEVERVFCEGSVGAEKRFNRLPTHHAGSEGLEAPLTTAHLSPFFEKQHKELGTNEDVAREIEMMDYVHSQAQEPGLSRLLVPLTDFAICANNLYVVSPYMPFKSLFHYKLRDSLNGRISEECAKHVTHQLLTALVHLHSLRIAHRDISIENVVFGAARDKLSDLLEQLQSEEGTTMLCDEDFRQLEVKLIDLGQAVRHASLVATSDASSSQSSQNLPLRCSFDTVTTTESNSYSVDPLTPLTKPRSVTCEAPEEALSPGMFGVPPPPIVSPAVTATRSASGSGASSTHPSSVPSTARCRDYHLLKLGKTPVGKATSMCPEHYFPSKLDYCGMCVDMWQMGMLILMMVTGRPPFFCPREPSQQAFLDQHDWMKCVREGNLADRPVAVRISPEMKVYYPLRLHVSPECLDLLQKLIVTDPAARLSAEQALRHRWFDSYLEDMQGDAQTM